MSWHHINENKKGGRMNGTIKVHSFKISDLPKKFKKEKPIS
jgi:hypothetical protein